MHEGISTGLIGAVESTSDLASFTLQECRERGKEIWGKAFCLLLVLLSKWHCFETMLTFDVGH